MLMIFTRSEEVGFASSCDALLISRGSTQSLAGEMSVEWSIQGPTEQANHSYGVTPIPRVGGLFGLAHPVQA